LLVETATPGFDAGTIGGEGAAGAIWQAQIHMDGVRVHESAAAGGEQLQGRRPRSRHHPLDVRGARSATPSPPTTPR
jgi:hypothetical protein